MCGRPCRCKGKRSLTSGMVGCCHVSGLLVRLRWPLALMKSAERLPNHCGELVQPNDGRGFCRSSVRPNGAHHSPSPCNSIFLRSSLCSIGLDHPFVPTCGQAGRRAERRSRRGLGPPRQRRAASLTAASTMAGLARVGTKGHWHLWGSWGASFQGVAPVRAEAL
jgi:hypothetical protein